jgi:anti-anti-sigma factor
MSRSYEDFGGGGLTVRTVLADAAHANLQLRGELDLATVDLLARALGRHLAAGRRFVRLDLSRLAFLDCAGLRCLVQAHDRFLAGRGSLSLTGVGPRINRLLRLTHLDQALLIAPAESLPIEVHRSVELARHIQLTPLRAL